MPKKASKAPAKSAGDGDPEELLEEGGEGAPRSRPFWSGTISFGLVTIPVDLYAATRSTRTSLRMLAPSGHPVVRRYYSEGDAPLEGEQLERGYELDDGTFVPVTDEELEALAPEQSRDIDLSRFVPRAEIPPLFFERAYILAPAGNTNLAYRLLASTLERAKKAGIASFVMRGKQYIVAIVAEKGVLRAETLRFAEELRDPETVGLPTREQPPAARVQQLRRAIDKHSAQSVPDKELEDSYWKRLEALVEKKRKHHEDVVTPEPIEGEEENLAEVIDLVAVLRRSLGQAGAANESEKPTAKKSVKRAQPSRVAPKKRTASKKSVRSAGPARPAKKQARASKRAAPKRAAHGR